MESWRANAPNNIMQRRRYVATALLLFLALASLGLLTGKATALTTKGFRMPDCQITVESLEGGTLLYVLPPNCGKLVVSPATPRPQWRQVAYTPLAQHAVPPSGEVAKLFFASTEVQIDSDVHHQPAGGYVLLTRADTVYRYHLPGDVPGSMDHTMQVTSVNDANVTVRFWPENRIGSLELGEPTWVDAAHDSAADMKLTLLQLNADGTALLRLQFIDEPWLAGAESTNQDAVVAILILLACAALAMHLYVYDWLLERKGAVPPEWWSTHRHDPLEEQRADIKTKC